MRYMERKEYYYDSELLKARDAQRALKMYAEYVRKYSPKENGWKPRPVFFEVDRTSTGVDPLWHSPLAGRTQFTGRSPMSMPSIHKAEKPDWRLTKIGMTPSRKDSFYISNLDLQEMDYFPNRGDQVFWDGYRLTIMTVEPDTEAMWGQNNIWLGMVCRTVLAPEGDARPVGVLDTVIPAERAPSAPDVAPTFKPHHPPLTRPIPDV